MSKMRRRAEAPQSNNERVNEERKVIQSRRLYRFLLTRMSGSFGTSINVHCNILQQCFINRILNHYVKTDMISDVVSIKKCLVIKKSTIT